MGGIRNIDSPIKVEGGKEQYQKLYSNQYVSKDETRINSALIIPSGAKSRGLRMSGGFKTSGIQIVDKRPRKTDHDDLYNSERDYTKNT